MADATVIVNEYRKAAVRLFGVTEEEAATAVYAPEDDPGEWAPGSFGVVNFEMGVLGLSYYDCDFIDKCMEWAGATRTGTYIEPINAAVAAIWS